MGSAAGTPVPGLSLGVPDIDRHLPPGGMKRAAIHRLGGQGGPVLGFAAWITAQLATPQRPALWIQQGAALHAPGLAAWGVTADRLILAHSVREAADRLWALEQGLRCPALSVVVAEVEPQGVTAARRLQLAAEAGGVMGLILPHRTAEDPGLTVFPESPRNAVAQQADQTETHLSAHRRKGSGPKGIQAGLHSVWAVTAAPGPAAQDLTGAAFPGVGLTAWHLTLVRSRGGRPGQWTVIAAPEPDTGQMRLWPGLAALPRPRLPALAPARPPSTDQEITALRNQRDVA